jgi:hypothetical protein
MKKFAYGALALAAVGAAGQAADNGWSGLDQEINSLSASLAAQTATGPKVGGYITAVIDYQEDPLVIDDNGTPSDPTDDTATIGDDELGVNFRNIRVEVKGDAGNDYSYKVSFDLAGGTAELKDAYMDWKITDGIKGRLGRYKVPFVRSGLVSDSKLLFLQRTFIGEILGFRDAGAMVSGQFEMVNFYVNAMNGSDGTTKDVFYNGRVTFNLMGDGVGMVEGAYGAGDAMGLQIGAAYGDDTGLDNGAVWAAEASLTSGPFSVAAEIADFDDDWLGTSATPWDATASFMFTDMYEIGARYEDFDDDANSKGYGLVVNRYVQGHDIKWTLQWYHIDTDAEISGEGLDTDQFSLGLTVAF